MALGVSFLRLRLNGCSKPFEPDLVDASVGKWILFEYILLFLPPLVLMGGGFIFSDSIKVSILYLVE